MSDDGKKTLDYKGTKITVDPEALKALQARVGMSETAFLTDVKDQIDWTLENDDVPPADIVIEDNGDEGQ
jgi:hypothetical protein